MNFAKHRDSIFLINIKLPSAYSEWINDMTKYIIMLFTIHCLQYLTASVGSNSRGLFNMTYWKLLLFTIIGVSAYYLVFRKIIRFRYIDEEITDDSAIYSTTFTPFGVFDRIREWLKSKL